jgi:hypothetical protein
MSGWGDRFNRAAGRTQFVVCRLFLHLAGDKIAPLLGLLNLLAQRAVDNKGDLDTVGEDLVELCQTLLQYDVYWHSAANEGDVFWSEEDAADSLDEQFFDSAQRYGNSEDAPESLDPGELAIPITQNIVVILTLAYEGESPELETDLSDISALRKALKAIAQLHFRGQLRAMQVHFAPAQLGDQLTDQQLLMNFPELLPL